MKLLLYFSVYRERAIQKSKNCKFSLNFDFSTKVCKYKMLKAGFYKNKDKCRWSHQILLGFYKRNAKCP